MFAIIVQNFHRLYSYSPVAELQHEMLLSVESGTLAAEWVRGPVVEPEPEDGSSMEEAAPPQAASDSVQGHGVRLRQTTMQSDGLAYLASSDDGSDSEAGFRGARWGGSSRESPSSDESFSSGAGSSSDGDDHPGRRPRKTTRQEARVWRRLATLDREAGGDEDEAPHIWPSDRATHCKKCGARFLAPDSIFCPWQECGALHPDEVEEGEEEEGAEEGAEEEPEEEYGAEEEPVEVEEASAEELLSSDASAEDEEGRSCRPSSTARALLTGWRRGGEGLLHCKGG